MAKRPGDRFVVSLHFRSEGLLAVRFLERADVLLVVFLKLPRARRAAELVGLVVILDAVRRVVFHTHSAHRIPWHTHPSNRGVAIPRLVYRR